MLNHLTSKDPIIGWFPDAYPDETFYSVCARFKEITGLSDRMVIEQLFASEKISPSVEFLSRLALAAKKLSWTGYYTAENIIEKHTLFPIYAPFITSKKRDHLYQVMLGNDGNRIHFLLGLAAKQFSKVQPLKYCPKCMNEALSSPESAYWNRVHQIRWIRVCPDHDCLLVDSPTAKVGGVREVLPRFIPMDLQSAPISRTDLSHSVKDAYSQKIAQDFAWFLSEPRIPFDIDDVVAGYRELLHEKKFTTNRLRAIAHDKLTESFTDYYPDNVLATYSSSLQRTNLNWLKDFFHNPKEILLPIRHILLMHFLGFRAKDFFQYLEFHKNRFHETRSARLLGKTAEIDLQPTRKEAFTKLWMDPTQSLRNIERQFNIDRKKLRREATRLGLPEVRPNESLEDFERTRQQKRATWLHAMVDCPNLGLSQLTKVVKSYTYKWLYYNDYDWLEQNSPPADTGGRNKRTDWPIVDKELAGAIPSAAHEIMSRPGKPVRAVQTLILRQINKYSFFENNREKLPLTEKALEENVESIEHYYLRVISWAIDYYSSERVHCSKALLFDRLKLSYAKGNPKVTEAFENALTELADREREYYRLHGAQYPYSLWNWKAKRPTNDNES